MKQNENLHRLEKLDEAIANEFHNQFAKQVKPFYPESFIEPQKVRPLNKFSDFVCEKMREYSGYIVFNDSKEELSAEYKAILTTKRDELINLVSEMVIRDDLEEQIKGLIKNSAKDTKAAALLDLKMMDAAISSLNVNCDKPLEDPVLDEIKAGIQSLSESLGRLKNKSGSYPRGVTYTDIVERNPKSDIRAFSINEEMYRSEQGFYRGHQIIEDKFENLISKCKSVIAESQKDEPNIEQIKDDLMQIKVSFMIARKMILSFRDDNITGKCPKEHFNAFRKMFSEHPIDKTEGPSGAFSARVQIATNAFIEGGDYAKMQDRIKDKQYLFGEDIDLALDNSFKVYKAVEKIEDAECIAIAEKCCSEPKMLRNSHMQVVKNQLGNEFAGSAFGEDSKGMLKEGIDAAKHGGEKAAEKLLGARAKLQKERTIDKKSPSYCSIS